MNLDLVVVRRIRELNGIESKLLAPEQYGEWEYRLHLFIDVKTRLRRVEHKSYVSAYSSRSSRSIEIGNHIQQIRLVSCSFML